VQDVPIGILLKTCICVELQCLPASTDHHGSKASELNEV